MLRDVFKRAALVGLALALVGSGCDKAAQDDGYGTLELAVLDGSGGWFRLRVFSGPVDDDLSGAVLFDTGCVEAISRTYELTNVPVGAGRSVYFEGFTTAQCSEDTRIEVGYRGDVVVTQGQRPYHHIPVYVSGQVTPLPEDLNLSAAVATSIDFCDADDDCGAGGSVCYDGARPDYWCVPTCLADADCATIHPAATCDVGAGWCMLYSPYPLNLSEPRAMGAAATLSDGSVAFIGGYGAIEGGALTRTEHLVEIFDRGTGLFRGAPAAGVDSWAGGLFGFVDLGGDRFAMVGGAEGLRLEWDADANALRSSGVDMASSLSDQIVVVAPLAGQAVASTLARPLARPAVVSLGAGELLVAGGVGADRLPQRDAWICAVAADLSVSCEATAPLNVARAGAAAACLDDACEQVLVLGGAGSGAVAELFERSADSPAFVPLAGGLDRPIWDPVLCGTDLVGGSTRRGGPSGLTGHALSVDGTTLIATPMGATAAPLLGAVARTSGGCYLGGGVTSEGAGATGVVSTLGDELSAPAGWTLSRGRFGAAGAVVGQGPLAGMALFGGGLTVADSTTGALALVRGVEVLAP